MLQKDEEKAAPKRPDFQGSHAKCHAMGEGERRERIWTMWTWENENSHMMLCVVEVRGLSLTGVSPNLEYLGIKCK